MLALRQNGRKVQKAQSFVTDVAPFIPHFAFWTLRPLGALERFAVPNGVCATRMSTQKRPGGPAAAAPPKRQNMADDEDEDFPDEEEMLAMEEEMADEAGQDVDGPAPPDEVVCARKKESAKPLDSASALQAARGAAHVRVPTASSPAPAPVSDIVEHLNKLLAEQKSAPAPQTKEKTGLLTDEELTAQHAIDESQISDRLSKPLLARKTARLNAAPAPAPVPTPAEDAPSAGELEADVYVLLTAIRWATLNGHIERCLETLKVLEAWDPPAGEGPFPAEVRASLQKEWVRMFGEYGAIPPSMLVNERRFLERNYDNRSLELRLRHRL